MGRPATKQVTGSGEKTLLKDYLIENFGVDKLENVDTGTEGVELVAGYFLGEEDVTLPDGDTFLTYSFEVVDADGKKTGEVVSMSAYGQLKFKMKDQDVKPGEYVEVTYLGKKSIGKGRNAHQFILGVAV